MFSVEINARLFFIVRNILINGVPSILDESLSARLYYIIRDINFSHDFYYFNVFGLSTYHNLVVELHSPENVPSLLRYDPFLSGSMLGRFVVQFGITLIIAILYYVHTMIRQKIMKRMFCLGTIVLITLQMISLMFIPFGIVLGCVLSTLRKQRI